MEFQSDLLKNAVEQHTLGYTPKNILDVDMLSNDLKTYILSKNKSLSKAYDFGYLHNSNSITGVNVFRDIVRMLRDELVAKYKDDVAKNLTIRKVMDTALSAIDCLTILGIDMDSDEFNAILIGYIARNLK